MNTVKTVGPGAAADYGGKDNVFVIRYVEDAAKAKEISLVIQSADDQEQDQWIQAIMNIVDPAAAAGGDEPPPPRPSYLMHKPESAVGMPLPPVPVEATASPAAAAAAAAPPVPRLPRSPPPVPVCLHSFRPLLLRKLLLRTIHPSQRLARWFHSFLRPTFTCHPPILFPSLSVFRRR